LTQQSSEVIGVILFGFLAFWSHVPMKDSEKTEIEQLAKNKAFNDKGVGGEAPTKYKKIRCHIIYDVKHDERRKSRLVAGGHLTDSETETVKLCGTRVWGTKQT
jgi:hypothetical protein